MFHHAFRGTVEHERRRGKSGKVRHFRGLLAGTRSTEKIGMRGMLRADCLMATTLPSLKSYLRPEPSVAQAGIAPSVQSCAETEQGRTPFTPEHGIAR